MQYAETVLMGSKIRSLYKNKPEQGPRKQQQNHLCTFFVCVHVESQEVVRPVRWTICWRLKRRCCQYSIHDRAECRCDDGHRPLEHLGDLGSVPRKGPRRAEHTWDVWKGWAAGEGQCQSWGLGFLVLL